MGSRFTVFSLVLSCCLSCFCCAVSRAAEPAPAAKSDKPAIDFDREIRPILAEHCIGCHGGDKPEAGLQLISRAAALKPADSGHAAIVPGKPEASEILRRILAQGDERMPPAEKEPLKPAEIEKLRAWIAAGAPWSEHWAFQPLRQDTPPKVDSKLVRNDIDRFVLARLKEKKLSLSPEADRYTLIKRLSYDLLGLPPSVGDVDAFVNDKSPKAYEALVDKLLASPHFGERWGRHWLDLARYADSDGYEKDRERPDAYLFRDWVIDAINRDLPFDRFAIEQLAGDLLPRNTSEQRLATAFNRQTLTNEEGGVDQEEFRIAAVFDRTETLGTVFMGLTIGCCRCHTHKYDPLPHSEYYKLFAFFNDSDEVVEQMPVTAKNLDELQEKQRPLDEALFRRYRQLAPAENAWNIDEHKKIKATPDTNLAERNLELLKVDAPGEAKIDKNHVMVSLPETVEKATYDVYFKSGDHELTGIKLYAVVDDALPGKGPGLATDGNFVLTGLKLAVVETGKPDRAIELHRIAADYTAKGFSEAAVVYPESKDKIGWSIAGKTGIAHDLTLRTFEPIKLTSAQQLKVTLEHNHGGRAALGKFRIVGLTGNRRGLRYPTEIATHLEMYPEKRVYKFKEKLFDYYVTEVAKDAQVLTLRKQLAELQAQYQAKLMSVRMIADARLPRETSIFHRGDFLAPTDKVSPGVPAVLGSLRPRAKTADRLDLARWLVSPQNSQTPRVAVNHTWKHLFGEGLVRSMTDFGVRGEPPTHPELLDWLAHAFRDDLRWSRKHLIRLIVTSATYRQSSAHRPGISETDPLNHLLARQNRFRVEAEIVRDISLSASGLLSTKVGGPSVFPPMPEDLAKLSYANNFSWSSSKGDDRYRRGMYTFFKRTIPHPSLTTFDCPDANIACVSRTVSNTPLQALTLLNNEAHVEAAQALARRVLAWQPEGSQVAAVGETAKVVVAAKLTPSELEQARLAHLLRLCIARPARDAELTALSRVLDGSRRYYRDHSDEAAKIAGQQPAKGIDTVDIATWVAAARVVLNIDEFITRE